MLKIKKKKTNVNNQRQKKNCEIHEEREINEDLALPGYLMSYIFVLVP